MSLQDNHIAEEVDCYLHDVLTQTEKKHVEDHVQECDACRAALEEGKKRFEAVKNVAASEAGDDLVQKTLQKVDAYEKARLRRRKLLRRCAFGGALALVLLFAGSQIYQAILKPSPFDLRVVGQSQFFVQVDGRLHVSIVDQTRNAGVKNVPVRIEIAEEGDFVELVNSETDAEGSLQASFRLPDWQAGTYQLRVTARPGGRPQAITRSIQLRNDWKPASSAAAPKLMLTSDRPVYKPGQTILVRSLALRSLDLKPVAGQNLVFSIIDPKENVIFKHKDVTSKFGIGSCECPLAHEILEGTYTVQCQMGEAPAQRLQVQVQKYVLPRFKIDVVFDKSFFQPGEKVAGKVHAHYFFGKPVGDGAVELILDDGAVKATVSTGAEGEAQFSFKDLPATLWERHAEDGIVHLDMQVRVTDKAGQVQARKVPLTLARHALRIEMIPEAGVLISGSPNTVFVLVTTADGKPARARVMISGLNKELETNDLGFAQFQFTSASDTVDWTVRAQDKAGQISSQQVRMKSEPGLLFRTDRAVYKGGDFVRLDAWGSRDGELFVDVIKEGQTLWTQMLVRSPSPGKNVPNFGANLQLPFDLFGAIELKVYRLLNEQITESRPRVIHVRLPEQVRIAMKTDRAEYLPGAKAQLGFRLTDANETPVIGALSLAAVDEAVFSVLQQWPGGEATFFGGEPQLVSDLATVSAEDRQLFERAIAARNLTNHRTVPASAAAAFSSSTYAESARTVEERRKTFTRTMDTIWRLLGILGTIGLIGCVGYFIFNFCRSLEGLAKERWLFKLGLGTAVLACVVGFVLCTGMGGDLGDFHLARFRVIEGLGGGKKGNDAQETPRLLTKGAESKDMARMADAKRDRSPLEPAKAVTGDPNQAEPSTNSAPAARIREWFPETLLWRPELITDDRGEAKLPLDLADSITTWRLSASAVTAEGRLGASTEKIKVFQPFFVEVQLPVALTRGDEVSVPVVVYSYFDKAQEVTVKLADADWFDRLDQSEKRLTLQPQDRVKETSFRIKVKKIGFHEMTVAASGKPIEAAKVTHADAIRRSIEVVPNGRPVETAWNGSLLQPAQIDVTVPDSAIEDSARLLLKIYPSTFSQALEGLDSIFQMPSGCFEQTSSSTYPNVLALDYLKRTGKRMPKVEEKARGYIHQGYQRLLSFEVKGGGFDWFGRPPANRTLTAYGLLEFQDMARVHEVDPKLIERTRQWLLNQRQPDGSWLAEGHVPAGLPGQHMSGDKLARLSTTSYIAWSVFRKTDEGRGMRDEKGSLPQPSTLIPHPSSLILPTAQFILSHRAAEIDDPHVLALVCNALLALGADADSYLSRLEALKKTVPDGKQVYWQQPTNARTTFYGHGQSGQVETTALATLALMRAGRQPGITNAALTWLIGQRDPRGTWYSTQATVLALKALLAGNVTPAPAERRIVLAWGDGRQQTFTIPADQAEVMKLENLTKFLRPGLNRLTLTDAGNTGAGHQVALRYHEQDAKPRQGESFTIQVRYEKDRLEVGETLPVSVKVQRKQTEAAAMVMIELPVPAGFDARAEDWAKLVQDQQIAKYQIEPQRILVYLRDLAPGKGLKLRYHLDAKMPVRIQVPPAKVYEYYNPAQTASSAPAGLTVLERLK